MKSIPLNNQNNKKGFTLAEVLVTLAIIGVVAALTIPSLINNFQLMSFKSAWKKEYSTLAQATAMVRADNGGSINGVFYNGGAIIPVYKKYIKFSKICAWPDAAECWASSTVPNLIEAAVLSDGALITVDTMGTFYGPIKIRVDVNGFKGPNECGKDILQFHAEEFQSYPSGADDAPWTADACLHKSAEYLAD